jgi:hypothetical protein
MVSKPSASATNGLPHPQNVANEAQVQIPLPKHLLAASPPQKPGTCSCAMPETNGWILTLNCPQSIGAHDLKKEE